MLDVNNFKYINDTYGHLAGDEVLQEVGKILQSATEGRGAVVRYGGDEFVILLEGDHREMGAYVREEITKGLARYNASGSAPCPISLSLGVSEFDRLNVDKFFRDMKRCTMTSGPFTSRRTRTGVIAPQSGQLPQTMPRESNKEKRKCTNVLVIPPIAWAVRCSAV